MPCFSSRDDGRHCWISEGVWICSLLLYILRFSFGDSYSVVEDMNNMVALLLVGSMEPVASVDAVDAVDSAHVG